MSGTEADVFQIGPRGPRYSKRPFALAVPSPTARGRSTRTWPFFVGLRELETLTKVPESMVDICKDHRPAGRWRLRWARLA